MAVHLRVAGRDSSELFYYAMRCLITVFLLLSMVVVLRAQPVGVDSVKKQRILLGIVSQANIADSIWYRENYSLEEVSVEALNTINNFSKEVTVEAFFGTWCDDSRYWVPAFIGLIDKTELADQVSLVALPRSKKTAETTKLKEIIERVPTFVFWRDGQEIGRIVESPEVSLAEDMIRIIRQ